MNASIHMGAALSDRLTPAQLSQTIHSGISHARRVGVADWMGAADALIEEAVAEGTCFSSGELSAYIRTYRPDLVFSANHDIGQHLRQRHQAGTLPHYTGDVAVTQLPRTTLGYSHSPAGINVFVYGPDERSVNTHLFEVDIPRPGGTVPADDALPPAPTQATTPVTPTRTATSRPAPSRHRTTAQVHVDRRLCVPRWAFTALSALLGRDISGGDDVYVAQLGGTVHVTVDAAPSAIKHRLVASRCRLLFTARGDNTFAPGTSYPITVAADGIHIALA
ncbi:MAG: hypothetical protein ACI8S6_001991 [Myxococcota bacterium]|jgi:hypothetical protein